MGRKTIASIHAIELEGDLRCITMRMMSAKPTMYVSAERASQIIRGRIAWGAPLHAILPRMIWVALSALTYIVGFALIILIVMQRKSPSSSIAWILAIVFLPIVG